MSEHREQIIMGGKGSTRWRHHTARMCIDECYRLDSAAAVSLFNSPQRGDYDRLSWTSEDWGAGLSINYDRVIIKYGEQVRQYQLALRRPYRQNILIEPVAVRVGGRRWFIFCPMCRKKVVSLYLRPGSTEFGCRRCLDLTYPSTRNKESNPLFKPAFGSKPLSNSDIYLNLR